MCTLYLRMLTAILARYDIASTIWVQHITIHGKVERQLHLAPREFFLLLFEIGVVLYQVLNLSQLLCFYFTERIPSYAPSPMKRQPSWT